MVGIVVLAAGNSSRLGQSKQLIEINGVSLLRKSVEVALQTNYPVVVVLGANATAHQKVIVDLKASVEVNHNWQSGMGSSLKVGLNWLLNTNAELQAVMILVCDQPYLSAIHLQKLVSELQQQTMPIIASAYSHVAGVPAIFRKDFFSALLQLPDDAGARKIIQQFADRVYTVPFEKGEIDIDTPQDLLHLPKK